MSGEEVRFRSDGCVLAGTFTAAANPVAAALLISGSGSGWSNRDSDVRLRGGRMLRVGVMRAVADALERARVSTLRYDKRGGGASDGDAMRVGMADGRADARAGLGWLADRVTGLPLLAVGHSEGTWYAAELAACHRRTSTRSAGSSAGPSRVRSWAI